MVNVISATFAFSKAEARGTLVLAGLMLIFVFASRFYQSNLQATDNPLTDSVSLAHFVAEVKVSYEPTPRKLAPARPTTPKYIKSSKSFFPSKTKTEEMPDPIKILDLNTASIEDLQKVRGIGPAYSKRIIKYRELLGGFYSTDQLAEVYGLDDSLVLKIGSRFNIQSSVKPINLNTDSAKVLARHPYISYDLAWILINYRKQNGNIQSVEDLQKIKAVDDSLILKLQPYLD